MTTTRSKGSRVVWGVVIALAILHWDFWLWKDPSLVFGFLPIGLLYHAVFSLVAAATWAAALKWCWPAHIEEWAQEVPRPPRDPGASR